MQYIFIFCISVLPYSYIIVFRVILNIFSGFIKNNV